jgi:Flp pilus assembly protein TadD
VRHEGLRKKKAATKLIDGKPRPEVLAEIAKIIHCRLFAIGALIGIVVGFPIKVSAAPIECKEWSAKIVSIEGRVESLHAGEATWQVVKLNDTYCPDDRVRTLVNSRAAIQLRNETILRLNQNSMVRFSPPKPERSILLELITGSAFFMSRSPRSLSIETPFVNAASGGTEFFIEVNEKDRTTTVTVIEGQMNVTNEAGSMIVKGGQTAVAKAGERPVIRILVRPRDTIQWALYYPPVLSIRDLRLHEIEGLLETDWRSMVQRSIKFYVEGDLEKAFSAIAGTPQEVRDPRFYTYRASLLLSVGRVDQAKSDIEKALTLVPRDGLALALQSMIAVVQNEKDKAITLAVEAEKAEPDSVSVKMALSYAHQANFDLSKSLAAAQSAVKIDPQNSLAWARLAELWLAHGEMDKALESAKEAAALNPRETRAQVILGFAYLTETKTSEAKAAFEKAIALGSADPMPRLGLGLAIIREGDIEQGRKEIEIAAALDPNNSLIRSYLGKAYYEEKRDPQASVQFEQAKELDPNDPTPYFYDAIRKQTINRPVEALHDLQKSIELNDNRAVYRSRMLLDSDLAARNVSLARIYADLDFQQLALVEGWKSVNLDPANYSAHRFLADSYAALPNSEIARVSELLQAQLLQPLNSNPVQPRLGVSTPAILAGAGPVNSSFNEFSQLFIRDRLQLLASGIVGSQSTLGEEVILTGLQGRYSYSLSQFHDETNGFRTNADINENIYDVFTQVGLTPKASIQFEYLHNNINNGDISLRFDPNNFSPTLRDELETNTYRLGFHYSVAPKSDIIFSAFYQNYDEHQHDSTPVLFPPNSTFASKDIVKGSSIEALYLFHMKQLSLMIGTGYFAGTGRLDGNVTVTSPPPAVSFPFNSEDNLHNANFYVYSFINLPYKVTLSIGGSADLFRDTLIDRTQFNPKLGLIWQPTSSTTVRAAGFRVLKRPVVANQTIEPTQVAGFQQFFDDPEGTDSKEYGIGIDQKFSSDFFGGLEFTRRDLEIPVLVTGPPTVTLEQKAEYRTARAYLYWTPATWIAASAQYYLDRSDSIDPNAPTINTHRVPLELKFFHPAGFFANLKATYIDQYGTFLNVSSGDFESGRDQFWIWDASVGYRLPKRLGILTIGVLNLLDRGFQFQEIDPMNPFIQPKRFIFSKLTLAF